MHSQSTEKSTALPGNARCLLCSEEVRFAPVRLTGTRSAPTWIALECEPVAGEAAEDRFIREDESTFVRHSGGLYARHACGDYVPEA